MWEILPMQETQVQSLGQEDPLEKEMATHSSALAWSRASSGKTHRFHIQLDKWPVTS